MAKLERRYLLLDVVRIISENPSGVANHNVKDKFGWVIDILPNGNGGMMYKVRLCDEAVSYMFNTDELRPALRSDLNRIAKMMAAKECGIDLETI